MERRDFFKRLGFAGAAVAVAPQILAEIAPQSDAIAGEELVVRTPDGREIPCKSFSMEIRETPARGGIYLGDDCVFKIYDWSLDIERPIIDVSRDPRYSTPENPVPPWKEYAGGPPSASITGAGAIVTEFVPFDMSSPLRVVLFASDCVYSAEGYITSLIYDAGIGEQISGSLEFKISGEITRTEA